MLKSFCVAALTLLQASLFAQEFSVSGEVKDSKQQQPLVGAAVQLLENGKGTITDESGKFQITGVAPGQYTVLLKFIGYADKKETIDVDQNKTLSFELDETFVLKDEVVVLATRADDKTPTTFTNVDKSTIQKQNFGQDFPFLLNWTPSVVTTSDAGTGIGYTGIRIRGSDATRINVTINGIPYNDSESQGTFWVDIPDIASSTQSVQIQRGVGTSTNGSGAFGGSVNVQTLSLNATPYANVMTGGGSFNSQRYTLQAGTGLIDNHWAFDGKVSKIKSDGYVERASSDLGSYYFSGGYYGHKTILKAIVFGGQEETYQSWYGVDGETLKTHRRMNFAGALYDQDYNVTGYYNNQIDHYRQDHYQLHWSQNINEHWNSNVSLHYTYGRGYYEEYLQGKTFADLGLPDVTIGDSTVSSGDFIVRQWLDNKFYGSTFSLNYSKDKTSLIIGGAWNQYGHAKHFGEIIWAQVAGTAPIRYHYYDGHSNKNDFNIYAKWNYNVTEALNAFVDLQYRDVQYATSGVENDQHAYDVDEHFKFFNPKAGLSFTLSGNDVLYTSYAIANREPNRSDFVDNDVKPKPEHLGNLELGWRRITSRYKFEATGYLMNYKNQLVLTGALDNVGNPIRANIGKSFRSGIEFSGAVQLSQRWQWTANVTYSVNKNKDFVYQNEAGGTVKRNTDIILSPKWIGGSQLAWLPFKGFQITWLMKYVGQQYLDNTQNSALDLDAYWLNDLRFNYTIHPKGIKSLGLSLLVNNILDEKYSSNGAVYDNVPYYYPQAGRNFMAMLTLSF